MITEGAIVKRRIGVYVAAAAAVSVAGVIHLMLGPGFFRFNPGQALLFTMGGLAQIFWIIPMVRRWGRVWYCIGIAGNLALFLIWLITRLPENPISGRGFPMINSMQMIEEAAQLSYIALASVILVFERNTKTLTVAEGNKAAPRKSRKGLLVLAGIVAALILTSLVLLPALMPRGGARGPPPPGSGSPPAQSLQAAPAQTPSGQGPP